MDGSNVLSVFLLSMSVILTSALSSQDRPVFLPEDLETQNHAKFYCKPGVSNKSRSRGLEITYTNVFNTVMDPVTYENEEDLDPSEFSKHRFNIKLRFPVVNKESLKIIGGLFYQPELYSFSKIGTDQPELFRYLNKTTQKSTGFAATILKSWNEKHYTLLRVKTQFNGDYPGFIEFDNDRAIYNVSGLFGFKKNDEKEWGIGINYSKSFRTSSVLPFIMYNRTFDHRWGVELLLPAMATLRHNISCENILLLGVRYGSRSSHLDITYPTNETAIYNFNHSEMKAALTLEKFIYSWVWIDATVGYQFNFSTDFESKTDNPSFKTDPKTSPFFKFGLFLSIPDKQNEE